MLNLLMIKPMFRKAIIKFLMLFQLKANGVHLYIKVNLLVYRIIVEISPNFQVLIELKK